MAYFNASNAAYGTQSYTGRIASFVARAYAAVIEWNDARVTRNALSGLSDRELEDIGLVRGDIDLVAEQKSLY